MTMLHPNVATKDPTSATATKSVLGQTPEIGTLGTSIATMQSQGKDFAKHVPITDANGSLSRSRSETRTATSPRRSPAQPSS